MPSSSIDRWVLRVSCDCHVTCVPYQEYCDQKRREFESVAVFPCKLRVLPNCVFNTRDPIVMGVVVEAGVIKAGTLLTVPSKNVSGWGVHVRGWDNFIMCHWSTVHGHWCSDKSRVEPQDRGHGQAGLRGVHTCGVHDWCPQTVRQTLWPHRPSCQQGMLPWWHYSWSV